MLPGRRDDGHLERPEQRLAGCLGDGHRIRGRVDGGLLQRSTESPTRLTLDDHEAEGTQPAVIGDARRGGEDRAELGLGGCGRRQRRCASACGDEADDVGRDGAAGAGIDRAHQSIVAEIG